KLHLIHVNLIGFIVLISVGINIAGISAPEAAIATPELITIAQVAFNTCKSNWVYCTNQRRY
ncbi:hypothetical protein, partial [Shigella sp. FC1967]|uniref:hypothetical protein n=1 Tax=Shigella sp. FC1967 TaxID=1898041 RepID=UPI00256FEA41